MRLSSSTISFAGGRGIMVWLRVMEGTLEPIILFIILEWLQRRRELGYQPPGLAKDRWPLKPGSPLDCPVCQRPHPKRVFNK